jgi:D-3-phosphoglycerate dehydrogenase
MSRLKVVLTTDDEKDLTDWVKDEIKKVDIDFKAYRLKSSDELLERAADADFLWTRGRNEVITEEVLPKLKSCKAIMRSGSGLDDIPVKVARELGIQVLNTPKAIAEFVAEHTVGLLLSFVRQVPQHNANVRAGGWSCGFSWAKWHVTGQTLGLVGFGLIAQLVTKMLKGFDMKVLAYDPFADKETFDKYGVTPASFEDVLENSDFVSLHCPLTESTHNIIGEDEFKRMKKNAVVINTSRGGVINERALVKAIEEKWISGAALDVTVDEPPKKDSPLLKFDNVVITPHVAAASDEFEYKFWMASIERIDEFVKSLHVESV